MTEECKCGGKCGAVGADGMPDIWPEGVKILIEADPVEEKTAGGLFLPQQTKDSEQQRVTMGTVLRVGPDAVCRLAAPDNDSTCVAPGDRVVFSRYGGFRLMLDKAHDYRIINDEDVLAVVRGAQ